MYALHASANTVCDRIGIGMGRLLIYGAGSKLCFWYKASIKATPYQLQPFKQKSFQVL